MPDARTRLLELLAEDGMTERDLADIEAAKGIVDEVNQRLEQQGSPMRYHVTFVSSPNHRKASY